MIIFFYVFFKLSSQYRGRYLALFENINNFNYFINFKLVSSEELVVIFLFYNFIKIIIFGSLLELIWPTQFFNRRHNTSVVRSRTFTESILKLKTKNNYYNIFNSYFVSYFFIKK